MSGLVVDGVTASLPTEILVAIFRLSVPNLLGNVSSIEAKWWAQFLSVSLPLKLGAVCSRWRQIAWSTPFLWTTLFISLHLSKGPNRVALIEQWLSRSKDLPLEIKVSLASNIEETFEDCSNLLAALAKTAHRWRLVDIHMPIALMKALFEMAEAVPNVQTMGLHVTDEPSPDDVEGLLLWSEDARPEPQNLFLSGFILYTVNVVWRCVTTIEVDCTLPEDCYHVLRCSPNLESCKFSEVHELGPPDNQPSVFVHENLRRLTYEAGDTLDDDSYFFSWITTPKLTHLEYKASKTSLGWSLVDFISRSSCPLVELSITDVILFYDELILLLRSTPSVTRFRLCPFIVGEELFSQEGSSLLYGLAQSSGPDVFDNNTAPLLPHLQSLECTFSDEARFPWSLIPEIFGHSADLSSPCRRPLKTLKVANGNVNPRSNMILNAIPKDVLLQLIELRQAGAEITYTAGSNRRATDLFAMSMQFHKLTEESKRDPGATY